jgi:hypothetical protein
LPLSAAILRQKFHQRIHSPEVRGVDQLAAAAALHDQASPLEVLQMEGE